ncbi:MAG: ankyrin repeat domain-containing protein [Rhodocyclaceae bacterium]|nr:ankyrin repeat domain-containing protein [Rhodocyclaceae bacterium]
MGSCQQPRANGVLPAPTGVWRRLALWLAVSVLSLSNSSVFAGVYETILNAAENGHTSVVQDLVARGMDINTTDADGSTLLLIATRGDNPVLVEYLLKNRAKVGKSNRFGDTALHLAASKGSTACLTLLLAAGAEVNTSGWTPLHYAAYGGFAEVVELLVAKGALLDTRAPNGRTALMLAAQNDHADVSLVLRRAGADADLVDYDGKTAEVILKEVGKSSAVRSKESR